MPVKKPQHLFLYSRNFNPDISNGAIDQNWNWQHITQDDLPDSLQNIDAQDRLDNGELAYIETENATSWYRKISRKDLIAEAREFSAQFLKHHESDMLESERVDGITKWLKFVERACEDLMLHSIAGESEVFNLSSEVPYFKQCLEMAIEASALEREAFDALTILLTNLKQDSYFKPPEVLINWEKLITTGAIQRPRQHGKSKYTHWGRDLHIALTIFRLELAGFHPTRNDESQEISASDIVAESYSTTFKRPLSYEAAKAIWKQYSTSKHPLSDF